MNSLKEEIFIRPQRLLNNYGSNAPQTNTVHIQFKLIQSKYTLLQLGELYVDQISLEPETNTLGDNRNLYRLTAASDALLLTLQAQAA